MKFDRTAPGGGVEVICRLENAKVYLEWNFYFTGEICGSLPGSGSGAKTQGIVRICLLDQNGNVVMEGLKALQEEDPIEGVLLQPRLWRGAKEPYLYAMEVELTDWNGSCIDRLRRQLPLRELKNGNTGHGMELLLNGIPFIPKAVRYSLPNAETGAQQQCRMLEDLRQIIRLGANCVCIRKEETSRSFIQFSRLCDRYGILVFLQGGEDSKADWVWNEDRKVRMWCSEMMPNYCDMENSLYSPDRRYPTSLYYKYKAKWSEEPFIYLVPESVTKLKSGNYSVRCYSNCGKVALYADGIFLELQRGEEEFLFREIPARSPSIMLAAEGEGCGTSLSMHKLLINNISH